MDDVVHAALARRVLSIRFRSFALERQQPSGASYRGVYTDDLEHCPVCIEPIHHLSLVMVCVHGETSHAVHHKCGKDWYKDSPRNCIVCRESCDQRYTALSYCLRVQASITVSHDTMKDTNVMDALKVIARTMLGIYKSKNVNISPSLSLGSSTSIPSETAEIEIKINHASFRRVHIPAELEDDKWYLSQHDGQLVLAIKDGISTYSGLAERLPRRPKKFISVTEMLEGVFYPSLVNPNERSTQLKNDPFIGAVEFDGKFYDLRFPIFEMERVSQTKHIYTNEGLDDLTQDVDIKSYLDSFPDGPFTLLFNDGRERKITLEDLKEDEVTRDGGKGHAEDSGCKRYDLRSCDSGNKDFVIAPG